MVRLPKLPAAKHSGGRIQKEKLILIFLKYKGNPSVDIHKHLNQNLLLLKKVKDYHSKNRKRNCIYFHLLLKSIASYLYLMLTMISFYFMNTAQIFYLPRGFGYLEDLYWNTLLFHLRYEFLKVNVSSSKIYSSSGQIS